MDAPGDVERILGTHVAAGEQSQEGSDLRLQARLRPELAEPDDQPRRLY